MVRLEQGPEGSPNFCFGLYDTETGKSLAFVQSDWDYAGLASSLGWVPRFVQKCPQCGHGSTSVDYHATEFVCTECEYNADDYQKDTGEVYPIKHPTCDHASDGTVDCNCGVTTTEFLSASFDWLAQHDGDEFDCDAYDHLENLP